MDPRPGASLKTTLVLLMALGALWTPTELRGQACTQPESVASAIPDTVPSLGAYSTMGGHGVPFADIQLGVGHLLPTDATWQGDWLSKISLPISDIPSSPPSRWIAGGWILELGEGQIAPFGVSGLVETGYEEVSFIVLDEGGRGWTQIRFAPPSLDTDSGTGWIPDCALEGETVNLRFESWATRLTSGGISPLFFRSDVHHNLRDGPGTDRLALAAIEGDYHLEPQEIVGDWMRVIVKQPSDYCGEEGLSDSREGWVRWRSDDKGPWVWYFTRGC